MKTAYTIYADLREARRQADKLDEIARRVDTEKGKLQADRGSIAACWKSENSNAYQKKMMTVETDLQKIASNLKHAAQVVRENANNTYNAEMRALQLAKERG